MPRGSPRLADFLSTSSSSEPKEFKRKYGLSTQFSWDRIDVVNYLRTAEEGALLPTPLLTEIHSAWMHTLDFLKPLTPLTPAARPTARSLAYVVYSSKLPTCPARPILLAGQSASKYLA